jgi:hypothetical protein
MANLCDLEPGALAFFCDGHVTHGTSQNTPTHFLDATPAEESSVPLKLLVIASCPPSTAKSIQTSSSRTPIINAMRFLGPGEIKAGEVKELVGVSLRFRLHSRFRFALAIPLLQIDFLCNKPVYAC